MYKIIEINRDNNKELQSFINFPYMLYKGDPYWVPPLKGELKKLLQHKEGMQLNGGPSALFMVKKDGINAARILVGVNHTKNGQRGRKDGYFALFEAIDDIKATKLLMDKAISWFLKEGVDRITGPMSPTNGDDNRGFTIEGFNSLPSINTVYTKDYYPAMMEALGMTKYLDFYAFNLTFDKRQIERVKSIEDYLKRKLQLTVDPLNLKNIDEEIKAIHQVLVQSMLAHWEHLEVPTYDQIYQEFVSLKNFIDPALIQIARVKGKPVGFVAGIPDYNQVLRHLKGKLTPLGALKFLYYRRRITRARMFMQFVIPEYQKKGVVAALYGELYRGYSSRDYKEMEGSTIAEFNVDSLAIIKGVGFEKSRAYRLYKMNI